MARCGGGLSLHSSFNRETTLWVWPPAIRAATLRLNNVYVLHGRRGEGPREEGEGGREEREGGGREGRSLPLWLQLCSQCWLIVVVIKARLVLHDLIPGPYPVG